MNHRKTAAAVAAVVLVGSFLLFLLGKLNYMLFLAVAAASALFAYKILPRIK